MKRENWQGILQSALLAFLLSFGAVGSLATAFDLEAELALMGLLCAGTGLLGAWISARSRSGWLLSGIYLGAAVYLWRSDAALEQTVDLLCRISHFYDNAYGWGYIYSQANGHGPVNIPLGILGTWIAAAVCWAGIRGRGGISALLLAAVPMLACVVVMDTVPNGFFLYLWLLGAVVMLLSRKVRRSNPQWGQRAVAMVTLPAALALALLFWAVPREGYDKHPQQLQDQAAELIQDLPQLWKEVTQELSTPTGGLQVPETVRLDNQGPRHLGKNTVMTVTSQITGTLYLRGGHFDTYSGTGWTSTQGEEIWKATQESYRNMGSITISTRRIRDVYYLPYYPQSTVELTDGRAENRGRDRTYEFIHRTLPLHWQDAVQSAAYSQTEPYFVRERAKNSREPYLQLPRDTWTWAVDMVDDILTDEKTATEVAGAIADYVENSAPYDLDTQRMPRDREDFARWFLEDSQTGYCVHFATATAVLLRAAGVEARYVEGYMVSARKDTEVTVAADRAHAWVEYYEPVLEIWIPLEATPTDQNGADASLPGATDAPEQTLPSLPAQVEQPREETQATVPGEKPIPPAPGSQEPGEPETPEAKLDLGRLWTALGWILIPAVLLGILEGQRMFRQYRRNTRLERGSPRKRALARWRQLAYLHRRLKTPAPEEARFLAERAKYSRHTISEEEMAVLDGALAAAREAVSTQSWYYKLLDRYLFAII